MIIMLMAIEPNKKMIKQTNGWKNSANWMAEHAATITKMQQWQITEQTKQKKFFQ